MIRLTLLLAFCIWLVFVLGPEPGPRDADVEPVSQPIAATDEVTAVTLESGEVWQVDRVIRPGPAPIEAPPAADASVAVEAGDGSITEAAQDEADDVAVLYVTGTRVNLRAGPSTDNAIVTALTQGTATEVIAEAPDGWFEIRDSATGVTGFMSGDFLSPTPP